MPKGRCHCGAVEYDILTEQPRAALCHCADCRRHAGAPVVAWALVPNAELTITGAAQEYASSEHGRRHFCGKCGTGLFYTNAVIFPDATDVQTATLDNPDAIVPEAQIQVAERIDWMQRLAAIPEFERYPGVS